MLLAYLIAHSREVSGSTLPSGPGRAAFAETCSRCHALPDPRQHAAADWPAVVMRMEQHMKDLKIGTASQTEVSQILLYLDRVSPHKPTAP